MKHKILYLKFIFSLFTLLPLNIIFCQNTASIRGTIISNGMPLQGVNIAIQNANRGSSSDSDGNYYIGEIPSGTYTLASSFIGYEPFIKEIVLQNGQNLKLDIEMKASDIFLNEIYVKGELLQSKNQTITVDIISSEDIKTLNVEQPLRLIEQVAGVDIQAYRQGGVADQFSIRGFGGGGHSGEAGVEIDGISLNEAEGHGDGYADLNVLIPLNLEQVKVYKGPSSVLFGRFAQGGTIALETRKGGEYQNFSLKGGSYGTLDAQYAMGDGISLGQSQKQIKTNIAFQLFKTDGYSSNSDVLKGNVATRFSYDISDKTIASVSLRGHKSSWNAPGYIPEEQFEDPDLRNKQHVNAENDGGEKGFYSERIDLNHTFSNNSKLLLFGYALQQDFTRFAKFGTQIGGQSERFNTRNVYATGGSLNGNTTIASKRMDYTSGVEFYSEQTDRLRWATNNRIRSAQLEDRRFEVQSMSFFAQGEINLSPYLRPSIGLRYDTYNGSFNRQDPNTEVFNSKMQNLSHLSPKLGIRSTLIKNLDLRLSLSNGFSLPNSTLKYDLNLDLEPVELWQYEAGLNYNKFNRLELDVAIFQITSTREILEFPQGSGNFINAGETQRRGIESKVKFIVLDNLKIGGTYSYFATQILDNPDVSLIGKSLTSIPSSISTLDINYSHKSGFGARFTGRIVGSYFISLSNLSSYEGYKIGNLNLFYDLSKVSNKSGRLFFEVLNLFNEQYAETVFGDDVSRSFSSAPPRNFVAGFNYNF